ncbi:MAG: tRNA uridine-5-carboxymethylaminomethyl(34) synthesis GTPase MnmE [Pseudomonadota bacterium]
MSTIFALSSGQVPAGVAVLRLSGPDAFKAAASLTNKPLPPARQATLRRFVSPGDGALLDEGLLLLFPGPASFTGEDVVELQVHGSRAVVEAFSAAFLALGLEPAEPGAFTRRAFRNQKMGLTQVEGLGDVLQAETAAQLALARQQTDGQLASLYADWRTHILSIQARIEAELDFSDEDLPPGLMAELATQVDALVADLESHMARNARAERVRDGIKVVLTGPPNAGKSTLLNILAQRDVAIVSEEAGTTRDALEVHLNLNGYAVTVVDTAGLRDAQNTIEKEGIARAKAHLEDADVVVAISAPGLEKPALGSAPAFQVMNKADLGAPEEQGWTSLSLTTGQGLDVFLEALGEHVAGAFDVSGGVSTGHIRHQTAVAEAAKALQAARTHLAGGGEETIVLAAEECRRAASAMARILGVIDVEDVLGAVFSAFCIGK